MSNPIENVRTSVYAAVGAGDYALQSAADVANRLRARAEERSNEWQAKADETRELLQGLPDDVPSQINELRDKFTPEELRKVAEAYIQVATDLYNSLAERGEETVDRLRQQPLVGENIERAESAVNDARGLTEEALGTVAARTREVGERAAKLAGRSAEEVSELGDEANSRVQKASNAASKKAKEAGNEANSEVQKASNAASKKIDEAGSEAKSKADSAAAKTNRAANETAAKKTSTSAKKSTSAKAPAKKTTPKA